MKKIYAMIIGNERASSSTLRKLIFYSVFMAASLFATAPALALDPGLPPGDNFDLSHWKLQLPTLGGVLTGTNTGVDSASASSLVAGFTNAYFYTGTNGAMVFYAPDNGATTSGSTHPRSEHREQIVPGNDDTNWTVYGRHILTATCRVTQVSPDNGKVCIGQMHEPTYLIDGVTASAGNEQMIMFDLDFNNSANSKIYVNVSPDGDSGDSVSATLITGSSIALSNTITYTMSMVDGLLKIIVNNVTNSWNLFSGGSYTNWDLASGNTLYFKAGSYNQATNRIAGQGARVEFTSLTIYHSANITSQPVSITNSAGSNVTFTVGASGNGAISYQWRLGTNNLAGKTSPTLTLSGISAANAGDYTVVVLDNTSSFSAITSSVASLTVLPNNISVNNFTTPGVTNWVCPADVTNIQVECWGGGGAGGSAKKLGSTSYGGGGAGGAYARYNSYPVTPGNTYYIRVGAGGANNSTNDNNRVAGSDSWFNSTTNPSSIIIAKGGAGGETATGTNAVAVYGLGGIGTAAGSAGDVVYAGGSGFTAVSSKSGGGGSSAGTGTNGTSATSQTGATAPAGGGNGGTGRTTSSGVGGNGYAPGGAGAGARSSSTTLYAGGTGSVGKVVLSYEVANETPPIIMSQPDSQVVTVGDTAIFTVGVNGATPLSYRWWFSDTDLGDTATNSTLVIANAQLSHAGNYKVVVTNSYGAATSAVATLTVETPTYLESLLSVDFEGDTVGAKPAATELSGPTAITATQAVVVVASTPMGTGQGVHYIDNGTAPMRMDYDLSSSVSALRFDFQFSPVTTGGNSTNFIVAGVSQTGVTSATQTNRYAEVRIYASGAVRFYVGASASVTYQKTITNGGVSRVSMFVNDSLDSITYIGADGSSGNTLPANQVAYWWNNEFVLSGNLSGPVNVTNNGLGRVGFASNSGNIALDAYIDNVQAWEIIQPASMSAPSVSLTAPTNGAAFTAPASIALAATASDTDGTITSVGFYNGATLLGSDISSPYAYTWTNVAAGSYNLTARATDNDGIVSTSSVIAVTVVNATYTLTVNSGSGDGVYITGQQVAISADAPASGMTFDKWTGDTQYVANASSANTTVTMPAQAAALSATYKISSGWYTLTVSNGTGSGIYSNGVQVTVAASAPAGTAFARWTGDTQCVVGVFSLSTIVTMPAQDATLTAVCEDASNGVVSIGWRASAGFYFNADPSTGILGPPGSGKSTIAQLMYSPDAVKDNILPSRAGGANDEVWDAITITENGIPDAWSDWALFASHSTVRAWTNGYVYTLIFQDNNVQSGDWYYSTPLMALQKVATNAASQNIEMNVNLMMGDAVDGTYGDQVTDGILLTVTGGSGSGLYAEGRQVAITADAPASGKVFDKWIGDTQAVNNVTYTNALVTMPAQASGLTATYKDITYALTVLSGTGSGLYTNGARVVITANTISGKIFTQWIGATQYVNNVTYTNALVDMPAQAVILTAIYIDSAVYHTLTGSAEANGTVSPTSTSVLAGSGAAFVITASNYYRIATLTTNGAAVTGMLFDNNSTTTNFIWSNVQTSGVLAATFTAQVTTNAPANTPYEWLASYGLTNSGATFDQAADGDTDSDGLTAWQEYIAGTNPTNAVSCLKAAQTTLNKVSWSPVTGRVYSVYWSTNLMKGFTALNTNIVYPQSSYTNATPDSRVNHYQIKVRLQ